MATPKKKHLIELMIEAGVEWPEGAEYAAQDKKDNRVHFYKDGKPLLCGGWLEWVEDYECTFIGDEHGVLLPSLCRNWHQTIVTREQYAEAVAANVSDQAVDEVECHNPPSIEQLAADYHAKAAEADSLQAVADEALKAADDALLALEKAGELLGLVISIDTKPKQVEQPVEPEQPVITDWHDLRVGDVIKVKGKFWEDDEEYTVTIQDGSQMPVLVGGYWADSSKDEFKFIRRP